MYKSTCLLVAFLVILPISGEADYFSGVYDFSSNPSDDWVFYNSAAWNSENEHLALVPDGTVNGMGQAWLKKPMPGAFFDFSFRWQPTRVHTNLDGFTFGWVEAINAGWGNEGGALGAYIGDNKTKPGYTGYFVEIDFSYNATLDPMENGTGVARHIALMRSDKEGPVGASIIAYSAFHRDEFAANNWYRMRVRGEHVSNGNRVINLWLDGSKDYVWEESTPTYSWTIENYDMPAYVHYGFTSATGGKVGNFLIDDVDFLATPVPSSLLLFAAGLGVINYMRARKRRE